MTAANILGEALKDTIKREDIPNLIVLGVPRGGVITADIVARKLSVPEFDIVIPRYHLIPGEGKVLSNRRDQT